MNEIQRTTAHTLYFALLAAKRMQRYEAELCTAPSPERIEGATIAVTRLERLWLDAEEKETCEVNCHGNPPEPPAPATPACPDIDDDPTVDLLLENVRQFGQPA